VAQVELSVVIPSRRRERVLSETLRRLSEQAPDLPVEVIVVYDGPSPERRIAIETAGAAAVPLRVAEQEPLGPAAARNRGVAMAEGAAVLFLGDDAWPDAGLLDRHLAFHREHREREAALLGRVDPAPPLDGDEFVRWLHSGGVQFGYGGLAAGEVPATSFWTANVSAKAELLRAAEGFDEDFTDAACEDAELGLRLAAAGMRLVYDPAALALHYHPTDLGATLQRLRRVGRAYHVLERKAPELPMPSRPGAKHRLKAAALTPLATLGLQREATWRFLCDEAQREAFWDVEPPPGRILAIGDGLARGEMRRMGSSSG
jgi:GT2 family glycosyltransferase